MAQTEMILGAVVMWLVLFAVAAGITRVRDWRTADAAAHGGGTGWQRGSTGTSGSDGLLDRLSGRPITATFLLLGVGVVVLGLAFAASAATSTDLAGTANAIAVAGVGFLLASFTVAGVYVSTRARGHGSAAAATAAGWTVGALLLIAVVAMLLFG